MTHKTNLSTTDLVGKQSPLLYGVYLPEINEIVETEIAKLDDHSFNFSWLVAKVFYLGVIAGVRDERSRRRKEGSVRK